MNIPDRFSESLETVFWVKNSKILKFFDADPDSVSGMLSILAPGSGMEKIESGI
jgi:hypothetical protein